MSVQNKAAPNAPYYTPIQDPPVGTALEPDTAPTLFKPLKIRDMTLPNRFVVSPMCQYSADNGHLTDWHFAHLSQYLIRGIGLTIIEATSVLANGRISPEDSGLWQDSQIAPLKRIVDFAHSQNQKIGIQIGHAGRKASTLAPWLRTEVGHAVPASKEHGGWDDVWAPSALQFSEKGFLKPKEMTLDDIAVLIQAFRDSARRCVEAGFDTIEIHGAHGYLLTEFLSPITNRRTDKYGGDFEGRTRLLFEIIKVVREVIPSTMPLLLRISATEWMEHSGEPSWTLEDSIRLAKLLPAAGVDLLDVSSGGNNDLVKTKMTIHPYYQIDLADAIRRAVKADGLDLLIGAVGMIDNAEMARDVVEDGNGIVPKADLALMARQLLREPEFALRAAHKFGVPVQWPSQYHRAGWAPGAKV